MSLVDLFKQRFSGITILFLLFLLILTVNSSAQSDLKLTDKQKVDSTLLSDTNVLTKSDYLSELEKLLEAQNKVPGIINGFDNLEDIESSLEDDDSILSLIKTRLGGAKDRTVSLKTLQTFNRLLDELQNNIQNDYQSDLNSYSTQLDNLKRELFAFRKDTIIQKIYKSTELRNEFLPQLLQVRTKWKTTDSLISETSQLIKNLKAKASSNAYETTDLLSTIDDLTSETAINAFGKERRYLWEPINKSLIAKNYSSFQKKLEIEKQISDYYFDNTQTNRQLPFVVGIIFFLWVLYNYNSLKRRSKLAVLQKFNFQYITAWPLWGSLVFVASLTPLFDLAAPALYTESAGIVTLLILTIFFIKRLPLPIFIMWCVFSLLFLTHPALRFIGMPIYQERMYMFCINIASSIFGVVALIKLWKKAASYKAVLWIGVFYTVLNINAVFCNLFGRVTLSQISYAASTYGFAQAVSLTVLCHLIKEAILLQIQSSRIRKRYPEAFEFAPIEKGVLKLTGLFASILWLIVFADNINVLDKSQDWITSILNEEHTIGSFTFSFGGIFLFLGIIWIANFFQKYISYFFGDLGEDMQVDNKEGRSRLLMTRLIVLIAGFMLAVAASGLPIDKITIILGALSVGIGLGLQNIVNNFVSGVILIFDRTLRIGDIVEVSDKKGRVREIGIRTSRLLTDDGAEIIIPNGDVVSHNIINWTLTNANVRMNLTFTIAKPYDIDKVISICRDEIISNENVLTQKEPEILITAVTPTSGTVKVYFWCKSITATEATYSALYPAIYAKLEAEEMKLL